MALGSRDPPRSLTKPRSAPHDFDGAEARGAACCPTRHLSRPQARCSKEKEKRPLWQERLHVSQVESVALRSRVLSSPLRSFRM